MFWPGVFALGYPGVLSTYWQQMLHVGSSETGKALFFCLLGLGLTSYPVGRLQERVGARQVIRSGILLGSVAALIVTHVPAIATVYVWAFLAGASGSFTFNPALTIAQRWWPERRGLAAGIVNLVFGLSAAIMSPLLTALLARVGYVGLNVTLAVVSLVWGMALSVLTEVPDRVPHPAPGFTPRQAAVRGGIATPSLTVAEAVRTRSFWILWAVLGLQGAAGISMVTLSVAHGLASGFSAQAAVFILSAFNLTNGISRVVAGTLSDLVGRTRIMGVTFLAAGIAYLALPHVRSFALTAVLAATVGFAFGTLFAVSAPLATDCFGMAHFGPIYGLLFTAYGLLAGLIGPALAGYLLDLSGGNFALVFDYLGAFCLVSAALIQFATRPACSVHLPGRAA